MDIMTLTGFIAGAFILYWGIVQTGIGGIFLNLHGLVIVFGGTACATMINTSLGGIQRGFKAFVSIFFNPTIPSPAECIQNIIGLAQTAQTGGGLLALRDIDPNFAGGFLKRATTVAVMSGESREVRQILEEEIRQHRIARLETSNFFRTMGVLSPMFGLLGTLLGIIQVLRSMSEPAKVGPAMALAITSAFYGIGFSTVLCVPVANKIRQRAMQETVILELILEGVMDIMGAKLPRLIEMHLRGYSLAQEGTTDAPPPA